MNKRWQLGLFLFIVAACAPKEQVPVPEAISTQVIDDFDHLTMEECQPLQFEAEELRPMGKLLDPSPPHTFTWDIDCIPNVYKITLYKYNSDDKTQTMVELFENIPNTATSYTSQVHLEPLSTYVWELEASVLKSTSYKSGFFNTMDLKEEAKATEFKALKNANCRKDPWSGENYVSIIWEGDTAELLGLNEDAIWGMFKLKNELECWVIMELVVPDHSDKLYYPQSYPVLEHGEQPPDSPAPVPVDGSSSEDAPVPAPVDRSSGEETQIGCMAPSGRSGSLVCQIPCPDPNYAARVCP